MSESRIIDELKAIQGCMGIYPRAVSGYNDERDYEQRDGYKNGWNAAVMEYGKEIDSAIDRARSEIDDDLLLFSADDETFRKNPDGSYSVFLNDTWYYACGDSEQIEPTDVATVAKWYRKFGRCGVYVWVADKRGHNSQIPKIAKLVDAIRAMGD